MTHADGADSEKPGRAQPKQHLSSGVTLLDAAPAWAPDVEDNPVEVALSYLQWRLVQAVVAKLGPRCGGRLGRLLGTPTESTAVTAKLSGARFITALDLIEWSLVVDLDLREIVPGPRNESLPEVYRRFCTHWPAGPSGDLSFAPPVEPPWHAVAADLAARVNEATSVGLAPLLDRGALRYMFVRALVGCGYSPSGVVFDAVDVDVGPFAYVLLGRSRTGVVVLHEPDGQPLVDVVDRQAGDLYRALMNASRSEGPERAVIVGVFGERLVRQMEVDIPNFAERGTATVVTLPAEVAGRATKHHPTELLGSDVALTVLAEDRCSMGSILFLVAAKA